MAFFKKEGGGRQMGRSLAGSDLTGGLQTFLSTVLKHLRSFIDLEDKFTKGLGDLSESVKTVEDLGTLEVLRKEYRSILGQVDAELQRRKGGAAKGTKRGPLLTIVDPTGEAPPDDFVDVYEEWIESHKLVLTALSKGVSLILDKDHPLEKDLVNFKRKEIRRLTQDDAERLHLEISETFFKKSNEINTISQERIDLKEIISALAQNIRNLSLTNQGYHEKLSAYAQAITTANELNEIQKIKERILQETKLIQEENLRIKKRLIVSQSEIEEANNRIVRLEDELQKVKIQQALDNLTKLFSRETFERKLQERILFLKHNKEGSILILLDLDNFKPFNEQYGPRSGDVVLRTVAGLVRENSRPGDVAARYEAGVLALLLPKVGKKEALEIAESIRQNTAEHEFVYKGAAIHVTISVGIRSLRPEDNLKSAIDETMAFLFQAKKEGKNRIVAEK